MSDDENALLQDASRLLKLNKFEDAAEVYQKLGEIYLNSRLYTKSLASFQKAIEFSSDATVFRSLARVYEHLHYPFSAYECLEQALGFYQKQKAYDPMLEICHQMTALVSTQFYPHEKLAEIYLNKDDIEHATSEYETAAQKAFLGKKHKKAIRLLYYAFKLTPQNTNIWIALKNMLIDRDSSNPNAARIERELQKLHVFMPSVDRATSMTNCELALKEAELFLQENLFHDAEQKLKLILKDFPEHTEAKNLLNEVKKQKEALLGPKAGAPSKDLVRSLNEDFSLGLEDHPPLPRVFPTALDAELTTQSGYDLAIAYMEMGLYDDAIRDLKVILTKTSDIPLKLNCVLVMSHCYRKKKQLFEAISLLEKSLYENTVSFDKLPREHKLALLYELSLAYEEGGSDEKALSFLRIIEREQRSYRDIVDRIQSIRLRRHESQ